MFSYAVSSLVEARVLEHDAEPLADLERLGGRIETVDGDRPLVGRSSVVSIWIVVVLPAPFGPENAKISPAWTSNVTSLDGLDLAERLAEVLNLDHCA